MSFNSRIYNPGAREENSGPGETAVLCAGPGGIKFAYYTQHALAGDRPEFPARYFTLF